MKFQLGLLYAAANRLPEALKVVEEVEKSLPAAWSPLILKGFIQLAQQNPKAAADTFGAALRLKPDAGDAHRGLAQASGSARPSTEPSKPTERRSTSTRTTSSPSTISPGSFSRPEESPG